MIDKAFNVERWWREKMWLNKANDELAKRSSAIEPFSRGKMCDRPTIRTAPLILYFAFEYL